MVESLPPLEKMTVITTHLNADFDALASMLAAQKLYPGAVVVFPGSQEKNLRNFFINSMAYLFNMADIKDIDFSRVVRLVLVDTRQPHRIGKLASLLQNPDIEVHIYDHHPPMDGDISGDLAIQEPTGANVTLLIENVRRENLSVTADEATVMCLGIYEDTGSFTFSSTTPRDFDAAAFLLSKGANLNVVSNLISREITQEQLGLLNDMFQSAVYHDIHGVEVVVTHVSSDSFIPDFAYLVHKMVKMEGLNAVFALARMENKIYVVARSRISEVDAGAIVTPLGGGGHNFAASASIKGQTLAQIEQRLVKLLFEKVRSRRQAKDIMSSPAITVDENVSCRKAAELLTRYNINALLVTRKRTDEEDRQLVGYITRQVIEKILYHKLSHVPVREYMTTEMVVIQPDSDIFEIQDKIIENKQRILPVVSGADIIGVLTRTDLLNILLRHSRGEKGKDSLEKSANLRTRNVTRFLKERLSKNLLDILMTIGETAGRLGYHAYVVGGFVRDLFLYRPNEDMDIVIEGNGIDFAVSYAKSVGARINAYEKFGTAVIIFPDGFKIDVASARMEYYQFPAALPTVQMSSIKMDLFRRDFTINTLAIQLDPDEFGTLIDFFFAQKDIKEKVIRVLHNLSFVEDPTRVFRAIRFEQRFGFSIGKLTSGLIENAVKMDFFKRLSGKRMFSELRLLLEEENPVPAIDRLNDYGLLEVIHPDIELNESLLAVLNATKRVLSWYDLLFLEDSYMKWAVYLLALCSRCDRKSAEDICRRLELAPKYRVIFTTERWNAEKCVRSMERRLPSGNDRIYWKLQPFRTELLLFMMVIAHKSRVTKAISSFISHFRYVKTATRGKDLQMLGVSPGPIYKEILDAVLAEKLKGRIETSEDEIAFIKERFGID